MMPSINKCYVSLFESLTVLTTELFGLGHLGFDDNQRLLIRYSLRTAFCVNSFQDKTLDSYRESGRNVNIKLNRT